MPEYQAPGLYVEEVDSGSKPIEGVSTSTAAFIGYAKSGDFNTPVFITSWTQFKHSFGEDEGPIVSALSQALNMHPWDIAEQRKMLRKGWRQFAEELVKQALDSGEPIPVPHSDSEGVKEILKWEDFCKAYDIPLIESPYLSDSYLAHALYGFFQNGGSKAYVVRAARTGDLQIYDGSSNGHSANGAGSSPKMQLQATPKAIGPFTFTPRKNEKGDIEIKVTPQGDKGDYTIDINRDGGVMEPFKFNEGTPLADVEQELKKSTLVTVEVDTKKKLDIKPATVRLEFKEVPVSTTELTTTKTKALVAASRVNPVSGLKGEDLKGDPEGRSGIGVLSLLEDVSMIAIPDLMVGTMSWAEQTVGYGAKKKVKKVQLPTEDEDLQKKILGTQQALVQYCEKRGDCMAILDPLPGKSPLEMKTTTNNAQYGCAKGQAAIYYPWIATLDPDPARKDEYLFIPPSGHIAGVWARVSVERGVHKAPANEVLRGAAALEYDCSPAEQGILNPDGINAIRGFPGEGIKIYGARTLATITNPSWKYVNVRRIFNYIESSVRRGMRWAVFEPNDHDLWGRLKRNISSFLYVCWRDGMLFGTTSAEAYVVKCDAELNTKEMIDQGRVYVEVGVNPVKPAEFVIIRIGEWDGGGSVSEA